MKRKIIAILMSLLLAVSVTSFVSAQPASEDTFGSIDFEEGTVIITPPGECDCCPECCVCDPDCDGEDCDCPCTCGDNEEWKDFDMGEDLYFGEWDIGAFGNFDSRDENTHTGIMVANGTSETAKIGISISEFEFDTVDEILAGAVLTLHALDLAGNSDYALAGAVQVETIALDPSLTAAIQILQLAPGSSVKASWYGMLNVLPGTSLFEGKAQATLTWTDMSNTP